MIDSSKFIDINAKDTKGDSPLLHAVIGNNRAVLKVLIDANVDMESVGKYGLTALQLASSVGHSEIVQILIDNNVDLESKDENGNTALNWAVGSDHQEIVQILIDNNVDVESKDKNGLTALVQAAKLDQKEIVQLLINAHANVNTKDNGGETLLMRLSHQSVWDQANLLEIVQLLLDAKLDLSITAPYNALVCCKPTALVLFEYCYEVQVDKSELLRSIIEKLKCTANCNIQNVIIEVN